MDGSWLDLKPSSHNPHGKSRQYALGTVAGWLGHRANVDVVEKRQVAALAGNQIQVSIVAEQLAF